MAVEVEPVELDAVGQDMARMFIEVANDKGLDFKLDLDDALPPTIETDEKRLQQVLKNLLSNAFKFTHEGAVTLRIAPADDTALRSERLQKAEGVVGFSVVDTGIGITPEKQRVIFEAFQQADGSVNRTYGGTGLGLSISREIARLLGGEIHLESTPGEGSTFTLYLPEVYTPTKLARSSEELVTSEAADTETAADAVVDDGSSSEARDSRDDDSPDADGDGGVPPAPAPPAGGDGAVPQATPKQAAPAPAAKATAGRPASSASDAPEEEARRIAPPNSAVPRPASRTTASTSGSTTRCC